MNLNQPDKPLTPEEQKERSILLQHYLSELFADYIRHNPAGPRCYLGRPIGDLVAWAALQVRKPTEEPEQ